MGNVLTYEPKVQFTPELDDTIQRVRYDFEYTKAELLRERFTQTYLDWCKGLNVKSRAQAYGRGFFPLESSLDYDIPECESWTMTWLRHRLGGGVPIRWLINMCLLLPTYVESAW